MQKAPNDHIADYRTDFDDIEAEKTAFDVEQTSHIRKITTIVLGNSRLIIALIVSSLIIAMIVTILMTPKYTAKTSLQINNQTAQVLGKGSETQLDSSESEITSAPETDRFLQTQMDIIDSRAIAERVAHRLNLIGDKAFFKAVGKRENFETASKAKIFEDTLAELSDNKTAKLERNSRIITISFTAADAGIATRIANAWADEFIQANLQRRFDSSSYAREFISGQLTQARSKLEQSERDLNSYARAAGLIKTRDQAAMGGDTSAGMAPNSVTTASLLQLNLLANQAEQARIAAQQRWEEVAHSKLLDTPEVLSNQTIGSLLTQRAQTAGELQSERARHLEDFPNVQKLKAQLDTTDKEISKLAGAVKNSVKQQYDAALETETKLKSQVAGLKGSSLSEQDKMVRYNLLARDADTNRGLYDSLLQRYKELTAAAGISASNIAIIDVAEPPIKPSSPKLVLNLAIGLAIGLALATLTVTILHQVDDAVRIPEDIPEKLGIPLLGIIPKINEDIYKALDDPKSPLSEGYSSMRGSLLFSTPNGLPRSLMVTSSQPAEGKSTTAFALAKGIAKLGRSVVLVDVDLRRPTLHAILQNSNVKGLTSLLTRQDALEDVIITGIADNLHCITSGPMAPSPTDLLSSDRMLECIRELEANYSVVILDAPPVLGLADAPLLSTMVMGTIFVVQADRARGGSLRASLGRLHAVRANVLGGALTVFDPRKGSNRYSEYYGYNYYNYEYATTTPQQNDA